MKVTINDQIAAGDLPEDFDLKGYLAALKPIWNETVSDKYPAAEIAINIDIQPHSGYTRPLHVWVETSDGEYFDDDDIQPWLAHDAEKLFDNERWYN